VERKFSKTVIISPSGNFYGSEQVLFDFLNYTDREYDIYIPQKSDFLQKVKEMNRHRVYGFSRAGLKSLYARIFFKLLFGKYSGVYVNEGGHSRYIGLMARFLPAKKFALHLRMIYDTGVQRLGTKAIKNIRLLAISKYVANAVPASWSPRILHDPFLFTVPSSTRQPSPVKEGKIIFGIIGRVSYTKGFDLAYAFIRELEKKGRKDLEFHFFGKPVDDATLLKKSEELKTNRFVPVKFFGYRNREEIYPAIDAVIHFCLEEGLGRIYLEAINEEKPFLGFSSGGLTEIAQAFQLEDQLIRFNKNEYIKDLEKQVEKIKNDYADMVQVIRRKKNEQYKQFSIEHYCTSVEQNIN
jgi:glycosyltransferase involved in cell wall biosynthesis